MDYIRYILTAVIILGVYVEAGVFTAIFCTLSAVHAELSARAFRLMYAAMLRYSE